MNFTNAYKEMREGFEAHVQGLEAEVQSLVIVPQEVRTQALDEQIRRRDVKKLLFIRPYDYKEAYREVKRQMDLLDEAYKEMREWGTYMENHNQDMSETIKEDKGIMLEL